MDHFYTRRERRALEKMSGLKADTAEIQRRKILAGKALQNQYKEEIARQQAEADAEREANILQSCIERGMSEEEAQEFLKEQYALERKRLEKKERKAKK